MEGQGGHIPRFGDWKTTSGDTPYTMYFEDARKRRSMGGTTPPPKPPPARGNSTPPSHRADAKPPKPKDPTPRSRSQSSVGHDGSVPTWGQWNESNAGGGTQQYTLVFEQIREERTSAPSTPKIKQLQPPALARIKQTERLQPPRLARIKHHNRHDHVPKIFTCFGLCGK